MRLRRGTELLPLAARRSSTVRCELGTPCLPCPLDVTALDVTAGVEDEDDPDAGVGRIGPKRGSGPVRTGAAAARPRLSSNVRGWAGSGSRWVDSACGVTRSTSDGDTRAGPPSSCSRVARMAVSSVRNSTISRGTRAVAKAPSSAAHSAATRPSLSRRASWVPRVSTPAAAAAMTTVPRIRTRRLPRGDGCSIADMAYTVPDQPLSGSGSSGPSGVRQQCSSHSAPATSAPAQTAPIEAAMVSEAAADSSDRSGST